LSQVNMAVAHYVETNRRLPNPAPAGQVGGWTIDILPYLEQQTLHAQITPGTALTSAPDFLLRQPRVMTCPVRGGTSWLSGSTMDSSSYVLVPRRRRQPPAFELFDAPLEASAPWASGPEMTRTDVLRQTGPHHRGFHHARGLSGGVNLVAAGQGVE
jgi:hypothetical protein